MASKRRIQPLLVALLIWGTVNASSVSLGSPSASSLASAKIQPSSGVIIDEPGSSRKISVDGEKTRGREPPASPIKLFRPDEFQFYTLNGDGQLVMKQMTKQEIQGMIANGGPGVGTSSSLPIEMGQHKIPDSEPKVSDVVQNVQKVLKDELTKPVKIHTSESSIPGNVNSQWSNILPYILSGSSVDQQDIAQDASIILPADLDSDPYVDVVPLQNGKPAEEIYGRPAYVPTSSAVTEEEVRLPTRRPTYGTSNKPISLLGSMALNSGILGEQNVYTTTTKKRPFRPTTVSHRFTTTRPPLSSTVKDWNMRNSSNGKPTLYIPLSVQPSFLAASQNQQDSYNQFGNLDVHMLSTYSSRPSSNLPDFVTESTTGDLLKKTTTSFSSEQMGYTRLPVLSAEKVTASTQRTNQKQTPVYEMLPTTSPASLTSTTTRGGSIPMRTDTGSTINNIQLPEIIQKPSSTYRPVYESVNRPSTLNIDSASPHSTSTKPSNLNILSTVYHPVYQPSTLKIATSTYRPVYKPASKPSSQHNYRPTFEVEIKSTTFFKTTPTQRPVYDASMRTESTYPTYTTRRASSPTFDVVTKPSTAQGERLRVTKYPGVTYPTFSTGKSSTVTISMPETTFDTKTKSPIPEFTIPESSTYSETTTLKTENSEIDKTMNKLPEKFDTSVMKDINNTNSTLPTKIASESVTPTMIQYTTEKSTLPDDITTSNDQRPIKTENYVESSSTELYTQMMQDTTKDSSPGVTESIISTSDINSVKPSSVSESQRDPTEESSSSFEQSEQTQSSVQSETTTPFILTDEGTTEYYTMNYDLEETKNVQEEPITPENTISKKPDNIINLLPDIKTTFRPEYPDPTTINAVISSLKPNQEFVKMTENSIENKNDIEQSISGNVNKTIEPSTPISIKTKKHPEDEITTISQSSEINTTKDKMYTTESYASEITVSSQEQNLIVTKNPGAEIKPVENTNKPAKTESKPSSAEYTTTRMPSTETASGTSKNSSSKYESTAGFNTDVDKLLTSEKSEVNTPALSIQEDEASTIKVIPIYDDDDDEVYSLPPDYFTSTEKPTKLPSLSLPSKTTQFVKPIEQQGIFPSNTESSPAEDILPGLAETFNNYMKEHYDPKLSTIGNYDDISHLTTFPTIMYKDSSTDHSKFQLSVKQNEDLLESKTEEDSTIGKLDESNTDSPSYSSTEENKIDEDSVPVTPLTTVKDITPSILPEAKDEIYTTEYPRINMKEKFETPIIYLELTSPDPMKPNAAEMNKDFVSNSSLTRVKVKNPVLDIDKIILEAQAQVNAQIIESYTLPAESKPPNIIASGLIAGYPTYEQKLNTFTESIPGSTLYDIISGASTSTESVELTTQNERKENNGNSYEKITTLLPESITENVSEVSAKPSEKTPTIDYQTLKTTTGYESYTRIPLESLPIVSRPKIPSQIEEDNDQISATFNPPLEKINDLINQLKSSPAENSNIGYDFSNGIATTIVPLEKFETIINETISTTNDETLTTIINNLSNTAEVSQNNTYVVLQTLPPNLATKSYLTSTTPAIPSTTKKDQASVASTTQYILKEESTFPSTTVMTIIKQPTTGRPIVTSTYSTTKGSLEKIQSTIDKSAGRINLEDEKTKIPLMKPTEPSKFTMKNKAHYSTFRRPVNDGLKNTQSYSRKTTKPVSKATTATTTTTTTTTPVTTTTTTTTTTSTMTTKSPLIELTTTTKSVGNQKENSPEKWPLVPQKNVADTKASQEQIAETKKNPLNGKESVQQLNSQPVNLEHASGAIGLDQSNKGLDKDVAEFLNMCNELSFKFWTLSNAELSSSRSVTMSPFGMISTLAMIFLGARGLTSNQMNDILKLDDVVTFNPHLVFQNITDTVTLARGQGIENAAFVRALFADRLKVRRIIPFYKEQAQQFYEGAVVDINFSTAGDILRRRTNLLIRKQTGGRIKDFMKAHTVPLRSPLTALSANVFQTSCDSPDASFDGRDGEMYFAVSQTVKQRKLVPIPAVVWKSGVSAGYEPSLDATAVALGDVKRPVTLIMVMPGQQGVTAHGDNLDRLEHRLLGNPSDNALEKLLKVIIPRRVELQMPKFSHRSIVNVTSALKRMGFDQLFTKAADLKGINGAGHDLFLADMVQMNLFCTCGDENKLGGRHLSETYPGTPSRHMRAWGVLNNSNSIYDHLDNKNQDNSEVSDSSKCDDGDEPEELASENSSESSEEVDVLNQQLPQSGKWGKLNNLRQKLHKKRLRWFTPTRRRRCRNRRQTEPEKPRMKMDKPFLYLIRHNLTGLILHIGRFNPKNQS